MKTFEEIQAKFSRIPGEEGYLLRKRYYRPYFLRLGKDVRIAENCHFEHPDKIVLEDDARINREGLFYGSGGIHIGRHARIGPRCFIHSANHDIAPSAEAFFERSIYR